MALWFYTLLFLGFFVLVYLHFKRADVFVVFEYAVNYTTMKTLKGRCVFMILSV